MIYAHNSAAIKANQWILKLRMWPDRFGATFGVQSVEGFEIYFIDESGRLNKSRKFWPTGNFGRKVYPFLDRVTIRISFDFLVAISWFLAQIDIAHLKSKICLAAERLLDPFF
ncbi:hypothetical protein [Microcoleus sp. D3_18cC1]|uniref:hypothetical protein n=1 Tax=Microcoleus sp. D3_18cC1 TaxID=3055336 RepID=UPI002FD750F9